MWITKKTKQEIEDLKTEIARLRAEMEWRTEVRIGKLDQWADWRNDKRPKATLMEIVQLLLDAQGLQIERKSEVPAETVLSKKPVPIVNVKVK